jgi:cytoskeletal protein RodZ
MDMSGIGESLREARENKELSYADVERDIKIRGLYLRAMEAEQYEELPGEAYTKGFLRTYSKYLQLDDDAVIAMYLEEHAPPQTEEHLNNAKPIQTLPTLFRPKALLFTAIIAIAVVVGLSFYFKQEPRENPYVPPLAEPGETEVVKPEETPTVAIEPTPEGLVVEIAFSGRCWLKVLSDGELAFEGTKGEGDELRLEALESVEFESIGASNVITIRKNGIELPPFEEQVVHNFLLGIDA